MMGVEVGERGAIRGREVMEGELLEVWGGEIRVLGK